MRKCLQVVGAEGRETGSGDRSWGKGAAGDGQEMGAGDCPQAEGHMGWVQRLRAQYEGQRWGHRTGAERLGQTTNCCTSPHSSWPNGRLDQKSVV